MEALAQLGGIMMMDPENKAAQKNFFFGGIEACKFRKPVVPGDVLVAPLCPVHCCADLERVQNSSDKRHLQMMKVELLKFNPRFGHAKVNAKAYIGASLCCEAELVLVMGK